MQHGEHLHKQNYGVPQRIKKERVDPETKAVTGKDTNDKYTRFVQGGEHFTVLVVLSGVIVCS